MFMRMLHAHDALLYAVVYAGMYVPQWARLWPQVWGTVRTQLAVDHSEPVAVLSYSTVGTAMCIKRSKAAGGRLDKRLMGVAGC